MCPIDIKSPSYQKTAASGGRNNRMSTYVMNGAPNNYENRTGDPYWACRITDAWSPMCYLFWEPDENANAPGDPGVHEWNDGANFPRISIGEGIGRLHDNSGGMIAALAGHVIFIKATTFKNDSLAAGTSAAPGPGGRTYLWWAPDKGNGGGP
jgi:hypothetical protein